jgi:hypothetical protein
MRINVAFDTRQLDKEAKRYQKNLAYSTAQALRATVLEAQRRIRESLYVKFHIRKRELMERSIKVFAFPSVGSNRPYAELGIDNKVRVILSLFESGGVRTPFKGKTQAVPVTGQARPNPTSSVREDLTFQALNFTRGPVKQTGRAVFAARKAAKQKRGKLSGSYYVWQGNQRTFVLARTPKAPFGGVFQRKGAGKKPGDVVMLYAFRPPTTMRAILGFVSTTESAFRDVFNEQFAKAFYRL